jgi:hypothetical protein
LGCMEEDGGFEVEFKVQGAARFFSASHTGI